MEPMTMGLLMGGSAAANIAGGIMGGRASKKAAQRAAEAKMAMFNEIKQRLEAIGIPSVVAQEIALNDPEYAGDLIAEQLGETELAGLQANPELRQYRMDAIRELEERSETGLTGAEVAQLRSLQDETGAQAMARDKAILSQMDQAGTMTSGANLAQRLLASQGAAQREAEGARNLASEASNRRAMAIQQLGQQAGSLEDTDFTRDANVARQRDAITEANLKNRMSTNQYNLNRMDNRNQTLADLRNKEQTHNKALLQQQYQNEMQKVSPLINAMTGQGQAMSDMHTQVGQGQAGMMSGIGQGIGNAATQFAAWDAKKSSGSNSGGPNPYGSTSVTGSGSYWDEP